METKLNYKRTFFIGLAFLSISAFWQMYDNIIPLILQNTFHLGETVTGVLMAMENVLALFLLPVFGTLSDKVNTPLGKRTPFILCGTVLAVIFMLILPVADKGFIGFASAIKPVMRTLLLPVSNNSGNLVLFLIALFATLLSLGLYRSPAVALMPDLTPNRLRSKANAVINLMGAVGGVYSLIMIRFLVGGGDRPNYLRLFVSVAALMAVSVGVLLITIRENKLRKELEEMERAEMPAGTGSADVNETADGLMTVNGRETADGQESAGGRTAAADAKGIRTSAKDNDENTGKSAATVLSREVKRSMLFMLASIFLWYAAYNAVTTAFSRYTRVVWGMEGGSFANCLMVATVAAIISYIPIGNISSRFGRKKTIIGGVLLMSACYLAAVFVNSYHPLVNIAFALIGVGWAAINVNSYPMIVAMSQGGDIGKFTGTYYTFSMAAQIITPVLSGFLLENVSYRTLFPYAVFFSTLAFVTMTQVRHGDVKPQKKGSLIENFDVDD